MIGNKEKLTKAQILADDISVKILHGEYILGQRLPSEREMSASYSVSRDTVRQAYNILEKTGLLKRVQGSGTHISTELRGHSESINAVAIICPEIDSFGVEFISSLESAIAERDTVMILKINKNPEEDDKIMLELMQKGINNFIIWPSGHSELSSVCARLRALGANIVFFDRVLPYQYADFVGLDNRDAMEKILENAKGRSAEVFSFLSLAGITGDSTSIRKEFFIEWCEKNRCRYDIFQSELLENDFECIDRMLDKHKNEGKKRAYVCVNDQTALKLIKREGQLGLVYGVDGLAIGVNAGVITVLQPLKEMAEKAVELLFQQQLLGDKWKAKEIILKGELIEQYY